MSGALHQQAFLSPEQERSLIELRQMGLSAADLCGMMGRDGLMGQHCPDCLSDVPVNNAEICDAVVMAPQLYAGVTYVVTTPDLPRNPVQHAKLIRAPPLV